MESGVNWVVTLQSKLTAWRDGRRVVSLARQVASHTKAEKVQAENDPSRPIAFFIASARLGGLSQNAAFSLLTSLGLRLAGVPVHHFVCHAGMSHCVLGTNRQDFRAPPPCPACIRQSKRMYTGAQLQWFTYQPNSDLAKTISNLSVDELCQFETDFHFRAEINSESPPQLSGLKSQRRMPLGKLVLPAIRWALRRHTLPDDEDTRYLLRQYILSADNVARAFARFLTLVKPCAVVIFNGIMYPEASARWVAQQAGVRVITHEVGFQRFSAFFTEGEATAYPIQIPDDFELSPRQNARLDEVLEKRFQGKFSMAGIHFWPEMKGLDESFLAKASHFRQIVPVFTNVVYDTSQVHANQVFPHMFAWLNLVLEVIRSHPETLFVIRAHPDEMRPGTAKQSRESVRDWVADNGVAGLANVMFIDSQEYLSSYELIQRSKFVMVYNSSIGMEAALMGVPVLCGGRARYTQDQAEANSRMVFFPDTPHGYQQVAEEFLGAEVIDLPEEFSRNARRFLYYQLFRASLSFESYLEEGRRKGYVRLRPFSWQALLPQNSPALRVILGGLNSQKPFLVEEADGG